ncbi:hypothetical protein J6590_081618 [Homalodisca vitripennis]|nr:hypothetical protein J6590_081618 [Homalodisca vitripennis]
MRPKQEIMNKNKKSPTSPKVRDGQRRPGYPLSQRAIRIQGTAKRAQNNKKKKTRKEQDSMIKAKKDEKIKKTKKEEERRLRKKLNCNKKRLKKIIASTGFKSCVGQWLVVCLSARYPGNELTCRAEILH